MNRRVRRSSASALVLSLLVLVAGCGAEPTAPALRPDGLRVGAVAQAVWAPMVVPAGLYARHIGPEGGTLYFGVGSLTFPRGALARTSYITAVVDGVRVEVDFGPEGLSFPSSARPTLSFNVSQSAYSSGAVLHVGPDNVVREVLDAQYDSSAGAVEAPISHFSKYIFGAN